MNKQTQKLNFLWGYIFAACITGLIAVMMNLGAGYNLVPVGVMVILVFPFVLPVSAHMRMRLIFSVSLLFAGLAVFCFVTMGIAIATAESLEGPNGEGAPIAPIFALAVFALLFLIPWVLVALQGFRSLKKEAQTEQASAAGDGDKPSI